MPARTVAEFVEIARKKPGELNFGNPGTGSSIDLSAQKLFQAAGIKLTNVGYKGQPQALIDLMTNLMHFEIVSLELALPHIKAGSVKPLAVMTDKRVADLPDVPTIAEAGFPEAAYLPWYGIYVQAGTPDAIVEKINDGINKALQNPEVQRQLSVANIPGKPMPLSRSCGTDEGGLREADEGDQDLGHGAAVKRYSRALVIPGRCEASNPESRIPGLGPSDHPGMTCGHFFTLLASILIDASSILVENALFTSNGFSMPR